MIRKCDIIIHVYCFAAYLKRHFFLSLSNNYSCNGRVHTFLTVDPRQVPKSNQLCIRIEYRYSVSRYLGSLYFPLCHLDVFLGTHMHRYVANAQSSAFSLVCVFIIFLQLLNLISSLLQLCRDLPASVLGFH